MLTQLPKPVFISATNAPAWKKSQLTELFQTAKNIPLLPLRSELWLTVGDSTYTIVYRVQGTPGYNYSVWEPTRSFDECVETYEQYFHEQLQNLMEWAAQFSFDDEQTGTYLGEPLHLRLHVEFQSLLDFKQSEENE